MIVEVARCAIRSDVTAGVMTSHLVLALAGVGFSASANATTPDSRSVVIAIARAQIVSGVRIKQDARLPRQNATDAAAPRERRCPERDQMPCRLLVFDIP